MVVLLCGLNDVKRASPWRTPIAFRHDLAELVGEIQGSCGAETTVRDAFEPRESTTTT